MSKERKKGGSQGGEVEVPFSGRYDAQQAMRFMGGTILLYGAKDYAEHEERRFAKMGMRQDGRRRSEVPG